MERILANQEVVDIPYRVPYKTDAKGTTYFFFVRSLCLNDSQKELDQVQKIILPKTLQYFNEELTDSGMIGSTNIKNLPNLKTISVDYDNPYFTTYKDQWLLSKDNTTFAYCPPAADESKFFMNNLITKIKNYAFAGAKLTYINIPPNLEELEDHAFSGASSLQEFRAPKSGTNEKYRAIDGVLYEIGKDVNNNEFLKTLVCYPDAKKNTSYSDEMAGFAGVCSVANCAFDDVIYLQNLVFSKNTASDLSLGQYAFENSNIKKIIFNHFVTKVSQYCFYNTQNLDDINFGGHSFTGSRILTIDSWAFKNSGVRSIIMPTNSPADYMSVKINDYGLAGCPNLCNVTLPKYNASNGGGLTPIGKYAFAYNPSLEQIDFSYCMPGKGSYGILPEGLFCECVNLQSIKFEDDVITEIGPKAFMACDLQVWPLKNQTNSLTTIGNLAFSGDFVNSNIMSANNLGNVNLNEFKALKTIGACAFYYAGITNDLLSFYTNDKGTSIIERIEPYTFTGNKFKKITFAEGIKDIEHDAITDNYLLTLVHLPNSLEKIEWALNLMPNGYCDDLRNYGLNHPYLPYCLNLSRIEIYNNETYGTTLHGLLYNKKTMELIHCPENYTVTSKSGYQYLNVKGLVVEDEIPGIKSLAPYSFFYSILQKIVLPSTLESIGVAAFHGSDLRSITIPSSVKKIGAAMFGGGGRVTYDGSFSFDLFMMPVTAPSMNEYIQNGKPLTTLNLGLANMNIYVKKTAYENGAYDEWKGQYDNLTYKIPIPSSVTQKKRCFSVCRDFDVNCYNTNLAAYAVYDYMKSNYLYGRTLTRYVPSRVGENHDKYVGAVIQLYAQPGDANYIEDGNWYCIGEHDYASGNQITRTEEKYLGPNFEYNWLVGCPIPTYVSSKGESKYALKYNDSKKVSCWAQYVSNGVVPMNKAYLELKGHEYPSSTQAKELNIVFDTDDESSTTDIDSPIVDINEKQDAEKAVYYNLNGMKVEHPTSGIYVRNGKKVIIK